MPSSESSGMISPWAKLTSSMLKMALKANQAALVSAGIPSVDFNNTTNNKTERAVEGGECRKGWEVERSETSPENLGVGDSVKFTKTLTEDDVAHFAVASGDTNPLHLDDNTAADTRFNGRIVHGTLVGGLISAALARLPGTVIYLSQDFEFQDPVRMEDRVTAEVEILEEISQQQYRLRTAVTKDDVIVVDGEAMVIVEEPATYD